MHKIILTSIQPPGISCIFMIKHLSLLGIFYTNMSSHTWLTFQSSLKLLNLVAIIKEKINLLEIITGIIGWIVNDLSSPIKLSLLERWLWGPFRLEHWNYTYCCLSKYSLFFHLWNRLNRPSDVLQTITYIIQYM